MNPLEVNPETGFLESKNASDYAFDSAKKKQALELAISAIKKKKFPSIAQIADALGMRTQVIYFHLRNDPTFKSAWEEVKSRLRDTLEESNFLRSLKPMGTISNLAHLKYLENGTWNQRDVLITQTNNVQAKMVIEAEILEEIGQMTDNQVIKSIENKP